MSDITTYRERRGLAKRLIGGLAEWLIPCDKGEGAWMKTADVREILLEREANLVDTNTRLKRVLGDVHSLVTTLRDMGVDPTRKALEGWQDDGDGYHQRCKGGVLECVMPAQTNGVVPPQACFVWSVEKGPTLKASGNAGSVELAKRQASFQARLCNPVDDMRAQPAEAPHD